MGKVVEQIRILDLSKRSGSCEAAVGEYTVTATMGALLECATCLVLRLSSDCSSAAPGRKTNLDVIVSGAAGASLFG